MASIDDDDNTLRSHANDCVKGFYELCLLEAQAGAEIGDSWAEDQSARFQLWIASLGVFAPGHASSDHRLRNNHGTVQVISQLLKALEANLIYRTS